MGNCNSSENNSNGFVFANVSSSKKIMDKDDNLSYIGNNNNNNNNYLKDNNNNNNNNNNIIPSYHDGSILGLTSTVYNDNDNNEKKCLLSCSDDKKIAVIENINNSWKVKSYLTGHKKTINRVISNGTSDIIWSSSRDLSLKQWKISNNEESRNIQTFSDAHTLNISAIAVSVDNKTLYSGSRDYNVKVWDVETSTCKNQYCRPRNIVTCLELEKLNEEGGGNLLYQGSEDLCIRVWDTRISSIEPAIHISGFVYFPLCLSLHNNGNILAAGCKGFDSTGCEIKIFDLRSTSKLITEYNAHTQDVTSCKFIPSISKNNSINDNQLLVSSSKDGSIYIWDDYLTNNNTKIVNKKGKTSSYASLLSTGKNFTSISALPNYGDKNRLAVGSFDGSISYYSLSEDIIELDSQSSSFFNEGNHD